VHLRLALPSNCVVAPPHAAPGVATESRVWRAKQAHCRLWLVTVVAGPFSQWRECGCLRTLPTTIRIDGLEGFVLSILLQGRPVRATALAELSATSESYPVPPGVGVFGLRLTSATRRSGFIVMIYDGGSGQVDGELQAGSTDY